MRTHMHGSAPSHLHNHTKNSTCFTMVSTRIQLLDDNDTTASEAVPRPSSYSSSSPSRFRSIGSRQWPWRWPVTGKRACTATACTILGITSVLVVLFISTYDHSLHLFHSVGVQGQGQRPVQVREIKLEKGFVNTTVTALIPGPTCPSSSPASANTPVQQGTPPPCCVLSDSFYGHWTLPRTLWSLPERTCQLRPYTYNMITQTNRDVMYNFSDPTVPFSEVHLPNGQSIQDYLTSSIDLSPLRVIVSIGDSVDRFGIVGRLCNHIGGDSHTNEPAYGPPYANSSTWKWQK
jgi:hypothetical protein